jgi:phosphoglycolate phosphatase-like HAD superfamily hydrolase
VIKKKRGRKIIMIRNIIWDVDGTLFDTYPAIAGSFLSALSDLGKEASPDWIGGLAQVSLSYCAKTLAEKYQLNQEDIAQKFDEYYAYVKPEHQPPFPGVATICGYICSIGGKNVIVTHRGSQSTTELLAAHKMAHYFAGCIARDSGYPRKPHSAAFEAILKTYDLNGGETIAVGDRDIDVLAAQGAGVFACLFGLENEGVVADYTFSKFDVLYQFIRLDGIAP